MSRLKILSHQRDFIFSDKMHTGLVGGFRSGKSHAGTIKTCKKKLEHPTKDVAYYLPTYGLIRDVAYPKFSETLDAMGVRYTLNKSDHEFTTAYGRILLRSMDNPDTIIGYETVYGCADEIDTLKKDHAFDAFVKMISRNSIRVEGKSNSFDFVSTPEGFRFLYEFFDKDKDNPDKLLVRARTENNPFISDDYIRTLEMSYSPEQLRAYLNGEFVNLTTGNVYFFSKDTHHSDMQVQDNDVLHVGMDFNVSNMAAVIHVIDNGVRYAVAEVAKAYDTADMIRILKDRYPNHQMVVYPDASGENRKSSGRSDVQLLLDAGFKVRKPSKNPPVRDRINAFNIALGHAGKECNYYVNTNNCPYFSEALERQTYRNGEPDKLGGFDHHTDAAGYFICGQDISGIKVKSGSAHSARVVR